MSPHIPAWVDFAVAAASVVGFVVEFRRPPSKWKASYLVGWAVLIIGAAAYGVSGALGVL